VFCLGVIFLPAIRSIAYSDIERFEQYADLNLAYPTLAFLPVNLTPKSSQIMAVVPLDFVMLGFALWP
jgi:hypothetical protein